MPLTMAKTGQTVTIRKITGKDEVRQHLAELEQQHQPRYRILDSKLAAHSLRIRASKQ